MIVEIDPMTFDLKILKYVVVHDCGTVLKSTDSCRPDSRGVAQGSVMPFTKAFL